MTLGADVLNVVERHTRALADALDVRGLLNVQFAVKDGQVYVLEANPRASRTVPFVSKATGVPLAKVAARVMVGATLEELRVEGLLRPTAEAGHMAVKEAVLPFDRGSLSPHCRAAFSFVIISPGGVARVACTASCWVANARESPPFGPRLASRSGATAMKPSAAT